MYARRQYASNLFQGYYSFWSDGDTLHSNRNIFFLKNGMSLQPKIYFVSNKYFLRWIRNTVTYDTPDISIFSSMLLKLACWNEINLIESRHVGKAYITRRTKTYQTLYGDGCTEAAYTSRALLIFQWQHAHVCLIENTYKGASVDF